MKQDKISVVLAVYNEEAIIKDAVNSLLSQETEEFDVEILVVDGMSDDGTSKILRDIEICNSYKVKHILNRAGITPVAFNLGIKAAKGNYIAIFGAHSEYASDYLKICLNEMKRTGSAGCSGKVLTKMISKNSEGDLCLNILTSPIGVSGRSFRTRGVGFARSIPYGVFKREVFDKVGLYDERLVRNQDNDMNMRIRKAGYKLYITDKTYSYYYPKSKLKDLYKYAVKTGLWNAVSLRIGSFTLSLIHYIPFLFLVFNISLLLLGVYSAFQGTNWILILFLIIFSIYWLLTVAYTFKIKTQFMKNRIYFPFAVYWFHLCYGFGTLKGFFTKCDLKYL